ncbi:Peroxide-responsive repressor PerR [Anaerolineae bacterium]|nr:Peroxide-responsive repressor PerR [Anaerolineae bacterium]
MRGLPFAAMFAILWREPPGEERVTQQVREAKIQQFIEQCKAAGMKVTPQRLVIFRTLMQDVSHPSPDRLYRRIKRSHPTISHATVYTTLEAFARHGIIARLTPLHETVRFDPITRPHHHIVCVSCKKVTNLPEEEIPPIAIPAHVSRENTVLGQSVYINVLCPSCRKRTPRG